MEAEDDKQGRVPLCLQPLQPLGGQSCPYKGAVVLLSRGPSPLLRALEVLQGWKLQEGAADLWNERWLRVALGDCRGHGKHPDRSRLHGFWEALAFTMGLL